MAPGQADGQHHAPSVPEWDWRSSILSACPGEPLDFEEHVPLAPLTTLRVGGPARLLVRPRTRPQLRATLAWARDRAIPWVILAGGSNVLVADAGFEGVVVQPCLRGIAGDARAPRVRVRVAAGEEWDAFVAEAVQRGWAGVECLAGIPGHVGATPVQNVGAYGQEVATSIVAVGAYDVLEDREVDIEAGDCGFGYRHSRFKAEHPRRHVITSVTFELEAGGSPTVRYRELEELLASRGRAHAPSLAEVREAVLALRRRKSMVVDEADPDSRSAGSFFVNPVLSQPELDALVAGARARGALAPTAVPPAFPAGPGEVKLSAAWLIEQSGFHRGHGAGPVGLSRHHALALVTREGATARDVRALAQAIQSAVRARFGVDLAPEPVFVGEDS